MGNWLQLDYTYSDLNYKEPQMSEKAQLAGIRGEAGFNFGGLFALSAGGEYQDGHTNYDGATFTGTPVKQVTNDYLRDTRLMLHLVYMPVVFSAGIGERYWYNNLVVSYRRRTDYKYTPLVVSYSTGGMYIRFEQDLWTKGTNTSQMHDVNAAAHDVQFTLGTGTGMAVEVGYFIPNAMAGATHLYVRYQHWSVKQSDVQNDGTQNLMEPDNNSTTIQAGIGLQF
jgi:hypothetical protein